MSDTGSDLILFLPKPSTLTVSVAMALSPLTCSDGDADDALGSGPSEPILGGASSVRGGSKSARVILSGYISSEVYMTDRKLCIKIANLCK